MLIKNSNAYILFSLLNKIAMIYIMISIKLVLENLDLLIKFFNKKIKVNLRF